MTGYESFRRLCLTAIAVAPSFVAAAGGAVSAFPTQDPEVAALLAGPGKCVLAQAGPSGLPCERLGTLPLVSSRPVLGLRLDPDTHSFSMFVLRASGSHWALAAQSVPAVVQERFVGVESVEASGKGTFRVQFTSGLASMPNSHAYSIAQRQGRWMVIAVEFDESARCGDGSVGSGQKINADFFSGRMRVTPYDDCQPQPPRTHRIPRQSFFIDDFVPLDSRYLPAVAPIAR